MDGCLKELVAERDKKGISDSESMTARSRGLRYSQMTVKVKGLFQQLLQIDAAWRFPVTIFFALIVDAFLTEGTVFAQNHGLKVNSCKTWKIIYMKNIV